MGTNVNNNPNLQTQFKQQQVSAQKAQQQPKVSGAQAGANLANMLVNVSDAPMVAKGAQTTSLLGPTGGEQTGNSTGPGGAPTSFSLLSLSAQAGDAPPLGENVKQELSPHGPAWRTELGQATDKAVARMEAQLQSRVSQIVTTAQQAVENNPELQKAAMEATAQAEAGTSPTKPGKAGSKAEVEEQKGNVFVDLVNQAEKSAAAAGINLKAMPLEDAVVYMMMICSQDARGEMKDMLAEMDLTRKKRAALREAQTLLKEEQNKIKADLKAAYDANVTDKEATKFDDWVKTQTVTMPKIKLDWENGKASVVGGTTELSDNADKMDTFGGGELKFSSIESQMEDLANQKDSLSDLSQEQQLKMQMVMERMTKMDQMASNLSKKLHDTVMAFVANLK